MSVKFEVKFESLLENLVDHTVIDDIKAKTFHNEHRKKYILPFSRRDNNRDKFWFDIIIWYRMFPDCQFISGFGSVWIQSTQKQN